MIVQPIGELEFKILSRNGELERMFKKPMDSFLRNLPRFLRSSWITQNYPLYDVGGILRDLTFGFSLRGDGPDSDNNYGILVGTGTNPVSCLNNALQTKIAHGNAAGQLYHKATTFSVITESAPNAYFTISRNFDNNSGNSITVKEVGFFLIYVVSSWYFILSRDLTGDIEVLNGKTLVAQYTFKVTA
jgi:hypothetical protein